RRARRGGVPRRARGARGVRAPRVCGARGVSVPTADDLGVLLLTLRVAALATVLILPLGIAAALALARYRGPGKGLLETVLSLPLVLPPTAVGLMLLSLLARRAPLGRWLDAAGIDVVFTWRAVLLAAMVMSFPLLVRSARTAFE